jgi:hypothetical protein
VGELVHDFMSLARINIYSKMSNIQFASTPGGVCKSLMSDYDNKLYTVSRYNYITRWDLYTIGEDFTFTKLQVWKLDFEDQITIMKELQNPQYVGIGTTGGQLIIMNLENMRFVHIFDTNEPVNDFVEERRFYPELCFIIIGKNYKSLRKFQMYQEEAYRIYRHRRWEEFKIYGFRNMEKEKDEKIIQQKRDEIFPVYHDRIKKFRVSLWDVYE